MNPAEIPVPIVPADPRTTSRLLRRKKRLVTLRLDPDILAWLKAPGPGYQTRMNDLLRRAMEDARNARLLRL